MKRKYLRVVAGLLAVALVLGGCKKPLAGAGTNTEIGTTMTGTEASTESTDLTEEASTQTRGTDPSELTPWITEINHYVMSPDVESFFPKDPAAMQSFRNAVDGIIAHKESIPLTDNWDWNLTIWTAISENPYYFVVDNADLSADHKTLEVTYKYDAEEVKEMVKYIDDSYLEILNGCITEDMSELEKVLSIYHYFAARISYNQQWYEDLMQLDPDKRFLVSDIAVYEALKEDCGVCHSYTYLCQFAFQQMGIECLRAEAEKVDDSGHMWPVVIIDGVYYNIDPTWDSHGDGTVGLTYFGMTDEEAVNDRGFQDYHISIDGSYGEFYCTDTRFADLHDVVDYHLNYNGTMTVYRQDGSTEDIQIR